MAELVRVERQEGVVSLLLNRPESRNALSLELLGCLHEAFSTAVGEEAGAVILSGSNNCFSAGADLSEITGTIDDLAVDDAFEAVTDVIGKLPVPVIAAIDGPCFGGAVDLALACDLRIASEDACFQLPATRLNLLYNPRSVQRMYRRIGRDNLFRLLVLGERFDSVSARRAGIVSHLGPAAGSYPVAVELARLACGNARAAVDATKGLLSVLEQDTFEPDIWEDRRRSLMSSPQRQEAVAGAKARYGKS